MLKEEISKISNTIHGKVIETRRNLHAHPELSFQEFRTANYIRNSLDEMGVRWASMAETGTLAIIKGEKPSNKVVALRADIDALPITEKNEINYKSVNTGVMHACGHDAHAASLLGTAYILQMLKSRFGGTVKLIFQPGEEIIPGGASLMIKEGVLDDPIPSAVIGQHVMPNIEAGKIGICPGKFMASMDELYVKIKGKGGHGAQPQDNIDPVIISSYIIVALQQLVSRMAHPGSPTVLSFGKVQANGAINVIPDEVYMEGTFRAMDEKWRTKAHAQMVKMATGIAESMGGSCEFRIVRGFPCLVNEEKLAEEVRLYAGEFLGNDNVLEQGIWMAAEDFAYFSQVTDSCFYLLGTGNKAGKINSSLHTGTFNIDESVLGLSTGLMAYIALRKAGN